MNERYFERYEKLFIRVLFITIVFLVFLQQKTIKFCYFFAYLPLFDAGFNPFSIYRKKTIQIGNTGLWK